MAAEQSLWRALEATLADERRAICSGDLKALGALVMRMEDTVDRLVVEPSSLNHAELERVRELAEENKRVLKAALDGIHSARARLTAIRDAERSLDTYDSSGRASKVAFAQGSLERRT